MIEFIQLFCWLILFYFFHLFCRHPPFSLYLCPILQGGPKHHKPSDVRGDHPCFYRTVAGVRTDHDHGTCPHTECLAGDQSHHCRNHLSAPITNGLSFFDHVRRHQHLSLLQNLWPRIRYLPLKTGHSLKTFQMTECCFA